MRQKKIIPFDRRKADTLWKLVEARRTQLADAIAGARVPFFLGLTWSFIWIAALYANTLSYVDIMHGRYASIYAIFYDVGSIATTKESAPSELVERTKAAWELCKKLYGESNTASVLGKEYTVTENWKFDRCKVNAKLGYESYQKARFDAAWIQLPAGLGKLHISDFGIMGNLGLLLILAWSSYASRRENHAIKSFIDFSEDQKKILPLRPDEYNLCPQDPNLSAEHYVYSYYAVAQRFLFLFSTHSRPLLFGTIALGSIPLAVSTINILTDIHSLWERPNAFEPIVYVRFAATLALTAGVWFITARILAYMIETSVLLNGWLLAVRDVWIDDWDERSEPEANVSAREVVVYVTRQFAEAAERR